VRGIARNLRSNKYATDPLLGGPLLGAGDQVASDSPAPNRTPNNKSANFGARLCLQVTNNGDLYPTGQISVHNCNVHYVGLEARKLLNTAASRR
jgi:hypothetical protein